MKAADFGPRGADVVAFVERLKAVDLETARALGAAWMAADADARSAAWQAVKAAAQGAGRERALQRARDEVVHWATTWQGWAWGTYGLEGVPQGLSSADTWSGAAPAALDAAAALVVRDLIGPEVAEILQGPWTSAVEGADVAPGGPTEEPRPEG
ncbi:MAG: hypothetical protein ACXVAE_00820 [Candidatus Limnocylindrales bacterium]